MCSSDLVNAAGSLITTSTLYLTLFTAQKTETITTVKTYVATATSGTAPTLCQLAVFSEDGSGNLTQVAITTNDTTLWNATGSQSKSWSSSWSKTAGQRYACGLLCVSTGTLPSFYSMTASNAATLGIIWASSPRISGAVTSQTTMPSSVSSGSYANAAPRPFYAEFS